MAYQFDYPDWTRAHTTVWNALLQVHITRSSDPITSIEIGSFEGRSTVYFADHVLKHPQSTLYCIDNWQGGEEVERIKLNYDMAKVESNFDNNVAQHPCHAQIIKQKGTSQHWLAQHLAVRSGGVDFVYVDGSHTQRDTIVDVTMALLLARSGGVVIVDDYHNRMGTDDLMLRPKRAVDFLATTFEKEFVFYVTPSGQAVFVKR